ncbi:hypothetical protein BH23PLA1_BH23PLA1_07970 [soil metagenome]
MTVRWKPLIVLSGLFLAFAAAGLLAFLFVLKPGDVRELLAQARDARASGQFEAAKIHYLQALQQDSRNVEVHEELAEFYAEWTEQGPPEKRRQLEAERLRALVEATKVDKGALAPRRALLTEALRGDDPSERIHWAEQVFGLDPKDLDARAVLAESALDQSQPSEARRHLEALEAGAPEAARTDWIRARIALATSNDEALDAILDRVRGVILPVSAESIDRMSQLRLLVLDAERAGDPTALADRARVVEQKARALVEDDEAPASRVVEISELMGRLQKTIAQVEDSARPALEPVSKALDEVAEAGFNKALDAEKTLGLWIYRAYAEHLAARQRNDRCLEVIHTALALPIAKQGVLAGEVMALHETAVKITLAGTDTGADERYERAEPHIKALIEGPRPDYQGLGHLFQGAIELERSGLAGATQALGRTPKDQEATRHLFEASKHLKAAASKLPRVATAQALYGVSLILSGDSSLGRQYLQDARRLGLQEPRYQVWAAWSLLQAGYPEEAEPIVATLIGQVEQGEAPADLRGTLHVLRAEIAQARRTPEDLQVARAEYEQAFAQGEELPPGIELRMAQLAMRLDGSEAGLQQLESLRAEGRGGPAAEHLAVATLLELGRAEEARATIDQARQQFPESVELVGLEAAMLLEDGQPEAADRVLKAFLDRYPDRTDVAQMRARLLIDDLEDIDQARRLLIEAADRSENPGPLVQLTRLDLSQGDFQGAARSIARVRSQWPEAASGDLLDAQLSLARNDLPAAGRHLDAALRKDPTNKIARFYKAQLTEGAGASAEADQIYEALVREGSIKELPNGVPLTTAARLALASLSMRNNDLDGAIARFEALRQDAGDLTRPVRWRLVSAYIEKGDWTTARREILDLLNDPAVSPDERVQAANFFRRQGEIEAADAQLDQVLAESPAHPGAVVTRAFALSEANRLVEAADLLRKAAAEGPQPSAVYLLLAGIENTKEPAEHARRDSLAALDQGLQAQPGSIELIRARHGLLRAYDGPEAALDYVRQQAESIDNEQPAGQGLRRLLADLLAQEGQLEEAEAIVNELRKARPDDAGLAVSLVGLIATQAVRAADRDDRQAEQRHNLRSAELLTRFREQFPDDLRFPQAEFDLALRRADHSKAEAITKQMDRIAPDSPSGPLLRARLFTEQGWSERAIESYNEAISRNGDRPDVRLALGRLYLREGRPDEARLQAEKVLETSPSEPNALLLRARAQVAEGGRGGQASVARTNQALRSLSEAIQKRPQFVEAYHLIAEICRMQGRYPEAITTLKAARHQNPDDAAGLALLVQYLAEPRPDGEPTEAERAEVNELVRSLSEADENGFTTLALAVGLHKAGRLEDSLPLSEKAAELLDAPAAHLNHGDLLLALAEANDDRAESLALLKQAVHHYDRVLTTQANSVEAINNKAWILHHHFEKHAEALSLAEGLLQRTDRRTLPGEFFDTLGAIKEALGRTKEAEEMFAEGLKKSPDHPILNFHMGRLIASDRGRAARAGMYLEKALASRDALPPEIALEVDDLIRRVGR